ncbi:MAG: hypothetical protein M3451_10420 [Chloroflexota bacterium]|nr:hypothetical protein [Chloroflexota bacterium]
MAYRFLLETPESLADDANSVVSSVPDAQVVIMRNSHGLGFDDRYIDLTVAAHSLAVVETIYRWLAEFGEPYPELRVVLHDGRRVRLDRADASLIIAAIRRDQPWVDTSMPMIGSHEPKPWLERGGMVADLERSRNLALDRPESLIDRLDTAPTIATHNLAPAEQFYAEVLELQVVARAQRDDHGDLEVIEEEYRPIHAQLAATEADYVFLENGPLRVTLQRTSRGVPLPYGTNPIQIRTSASPDQVATIKGRILMNGYNLLDSDAGVLSFADPFNVIWTITPTTTGADRAAALQG